jgi:hypothetical protein
VALRVNQALGEQDPLFRAPQATQEPATGQRAEDGGGRERAPTRPVKPRTPRAPSVEEILADLEAKVAEGMGWVDLSVSPSGKSYWGTAPLPQEGRHPVPLAAHSWEQAQYVVLHLKRWGWFLELVQEDWYHWVARAVNRRHQVERDGKRAYTTVEVSDGTLPEAVCKVFCQVVLHRNACMRFQAGALPIRRDEDIVDGCARCGKERESHP